MIGSSSACALLPALALTALWAIAPGGAAAQNRAVLRGSVLDPAQSAIAGARVTAQREGTTGVVEVVSDSRGEFLLALEPAAYTITAGAEGFLGQSQTVTLAPGAASTLDFVLKLGGIRQTVTVSESSRYQVAAISSATRTMTPVRDVPQSVSVVSQEQIQDQMMMSVADVVRYVPGITAIQGENNRDQLVIRGNSTSADFFLDGVRDDVQYYRDLYNLDRVEALKGPNAMMFGRGGGGGVVNRATKQAGFAPLHEISLVGGSFGNKRAAADFNQPLNAKAALRLNAMYENSGSFRDYGHLVRHGINPTLTLVPSARTRITLGYENARDDRVADRGVPSYRGRPVDTVRTFFGDPWQSHVGSRVNLGSVAVEHQAGSVTLRNRTLIGDYDRGYQNFVPGVVSADKSRVTLSAYNNATRRRNVFNQTDVTFSRQTGRLRHQLLAGAEVGRQQTGNFRNTGYFNESATSMQAPFSAPTVHAAVVFRQSATDADNHVTTNVAAAYFQDQLEISSRLQLIAGLRFDRFDLRYRNNRTGEVLQRVDHLVSPRAGIVFKPVAPLSLYVSYSETHLPGSGDQFSSLTVVTQQVKPEHVGNYEVGAKWDASQAFSVTAALYQLNRTNTRSTDPNDPTRIVQTGSQRTNGFELGVNGNVTRRWSIAGGYAWQDAFVTRATTAARAGAQVAQVPHQTFSLWNHYRLTTRLGAGLGVVNRSDMFAAIDNTVILPGYTRADAAVYYSFSDSVRLQANVENLTGRKYFVNADSNANISPGSGRAARIGLVTRF